MSLAEALALARARRWAASAARTARPARIAADQLEVAVLDRQRAGRTFRRITGAALTALLDGGVAATDQPSRGGRPATSRRGVPSRPAEADRVGGLGRPGGQAADGKQHQHCELPTVAAALRRLLAASAAAIGRW